MLPPVLEKARITSPKAYRELIKSNLTILLDIDREFSFDDIDVIVKRHADTIFGATLTQEGSCTINQLIDHILKRTNIEQEGLFRVSGCKNRQDVIEARLCTGTTLDVDLSKFKIHDVCGLLKKFLRDLPQPLLLSSLVDLWVQIKPEPRYLDAVQLLLLLLPSVNLEFFKDLIKMFTSICTYSSRNKMTSLNLAVIFTPILFLANDVEPQLLANLTGPLTKCLHFMINEGSKIFEPPQKLLDDARTYLNKVEASSASARFQSRMGGHLMSTTGLIPATKFTAPIEHDTKDYTQQALAELMEQIKTMTPSSVKKTSRTTKLIKKISKTPGTMDTPLTKLKRDKEQQALIKEAMKARAAATPSTGGLKSFGSALKKRLGMTPSSERTSGKSSPAGGSRKSISSSSIPFSGIVNFGASSTTASNGCSNSNTRYYTIASRRVSRGSIIPLEEDPLTPNFNSHVIPATTPKRKSISTGAMNVTLTPVVSPIDEEEEQPTSQQSEPQPEPEAIVVPPRRTLSKPLPPPVPPKPSPRTILKRKASVYSLPPATTSKLADPSARSISAKSLPACPRTDSFCRIRPAAPVQDMPTPLKELSNQRKVTNLREKYESMTRGPVSKIPRLSRRPSVPKSNAPSVDEENDAENEYVCMSKIPKKKAKAPSPLATPTSALPRRHSSRKGKVPPKSPISLKPVDENLILESMIRLSAKKTRIRRPVDLDRLQPRTPL